MVDVDSENKSSHESLTLMCTLAMKSTFCLAVSVVSQSSTVAQDASGCLRRWMATCMAAARGELPRKHLGCGQCSKALLGDDYSGLHQLICWGLWSSNRGMIDFDHCSVGFELQHLHKVNCIGFRFMVEIDMVWWNNECSLDAPHCVENMLIS